MTSETVLNDAPVSAENGVDFDLLDLDDLLLFDDDNDANPSSPQDPHDPHGIYSSLPLFSNRPVLANERTQIRSDPVPGLSVDTLGAFQVEIAVTRSESCLDQSGRDIGTTRLGQGFCEVGRVGFCFSQTRYDIGRVSNLIGIPA